MDPAGGVPQNRRTAGNLCSQGVKRCEQPGEDGKGHWPAPRRRWRISSTLDSRQCSYLPNVGYLLIRSYFSDELPALTGYTVEEYQGMIGQDAAEMTYKEDTAMVVSGLCRWSKAKAWMNLSSMKQHRDRHYCMGAGTDQMDRRGARGYPLLLRVPQHFRP